MYQEQMRVMCVSVCLCDAHKNTRMWGILSRAHMHTIHTHTLSLSHTLYAHILYREE